MTSLFNPDLQVLLLEGIHTQARLLFEEAGCRHIEESPTPPPSLNKVQILGIRSRTQLTKELIESLPNLLAIGCFCVGTDQVDLQAATFCGIPVFNAPHSNTRSVAELVIGEIIMLMRGIIPKHQALLQGEWKKSAHGSYEVRGKTLGIIGYGRIGTQVSILAEALGMQVCFYDIENRLPIGNVRRMANLDALLKASDVVTVHVPQSEQTRLLLNPANLKKMRKGSYLLNLSRGGVVDLEVLDALLSSGHIAGAAIDVYPKEPKNRDEPFTAPFHSHPNLILTPHIAGSTEEAQENITREVTHKLLSYLQHGSTVGCVNLPELTLPPVKHAHRVVHIHRNIPGILSKINDTIAARKINIAAQYLLTNADVGYVVFDIEKNLSGKLLEGLKEIQGTIRTHVIY